ncbi:ABC transporter ATP-binding protein [Ornithinibacillus salinisoli]|uniref:ABC transporter ATP-binding protein n=1 Tax=Ornithinibacillus salinisoli TaxID=1848459 RepID=A0ABW4VWJ6_9BACI
MEILSAKNITFNYAGSQHKVLDGVEFSVEKGDFLLVCGPSGSGKSTLLRLLKEDVAPHGKLNGSILYNGAPINEYDRLKVTQEIGMVFQDPENQIVMELVLDELLFGMENMGFTTEQMRKKLAEMVHFFGLSDLVGKKTDKLSGGQKQLINLASVLLLEPTILLLDEPTAQLDPIAAKEFIYSLKRLNEEFGITVIMVEHRLEELFAIANRVIVLDEGKIVVDSDPKEAIYRMHANMRHYLPSTALLYLDISNDFQQEKIPLSVKATKQWLSTQNIAFSQGQDETLPYKEPLVELKGIDYQYSKHEAPVLYNLSFSINRGEWMALVGANGTGKTTLLNIFGGMIKPQHGSITYNGKKVRKIDSTQIGYLPQNPKIFFVQDTVRKEYQQIALTYQKKEKEITYLVEKFQLNDLLDRHPYDLSGGELQKAALVGILLSKPSLLLVDEPTKGMDPDFKKEFGTLMQGLVADGLTILMVTHDIEFAASYTTRCSMIFQGNITVTEPTKQFFRGNTYYTTAMNRIMRDIQALPPVTLEEAVPLSPVQSGY